MTDKQFEQGWRLQIIEDSIRVALSDLEKIDTVKVAGRGLSSEATAVSAARVHLDGVLDLLRPERKTETK